MLLYNNHYKHCFISTVIKNYYFFIIFIFFIFSLCFIHLRWLALRTLFIGSLKFINTHYCISKPMCVRLYLWACLVLAYCMPTISRYTPLIQISERDKRHIPTCTYQVTWENAAIQRNGSHPPTYNRCVASSLSFEQTIMAHLIYARNKNARCLAAAACYAT